MQVKWLKKALDDLHSEASYISGNDLAAAKKIVTAVFTVIDHLKENPGLGRPGRVIGTRELIVPNTPYIIPYRVNSRLQQVEILRVFHTSRKVPSKW